MMLALGYFVFMQKTLPFQSTTRTAGFSWKSNDRVGKRAAFQYTGPETETMAITGELYPELTGGLPTLSLVRQMAALGKAWPLINGSGIIYGMFVITSLREESTLFHSDGTPRKITFTLQLTRVDESAEAMLSDLRDLGEQAWGSLSNELGVS